MPKSDSPVLPSSNAVPRKHGPVAYHYNRATGEGYIIIARIWGTFFKTGMAGRGFAPAAA
jgi:hypothetical protein